MFKLPFLSKSSDPDYFLIVDIGSDVLKVLVCHVVLDDDQDPYVEILDVATESLPPDLVRGGVVIDIEGVASVLKSAALQATATIGKKVKTLFLALAEIYLYVY